MFDCIVDSMIPSNDDTERYDRMFAKFAFV